MGKLFNLKRNIFINYLMKTKKQAEQKSGFVYVLYPNGKKL